MRAKMTGSIRRWISATALVASIHDLCAELKVSSKFESGSARVVAMDTNTQTIRFQSAGDARRGWQNWWFLRVDGVDTRRPMGP